MEPTFFKQLYCSQQVKVGDEVFPKILGPSKDDSYVSLESQLKRNSDHLIGLVNQHGVAILRGFDIKSPNEATAVINKLGLESFEYIGGAAVRRLIIGKENATSQSVEMFTTNESPPSEPIPFHNELLQNQTYPDYLAFYCQLESETGGSTPVVNCKIIYEFLQKKHPSFLKDLEAKGVRYIRVVGQQDNPKSAIGRGWKNIFKVSNQEEAQQKMKESSYEWEWMGGADNDCKIISAALPAVTETALKDKVFCNQMIAVFKGWVDDKNQPKDCLKMGDFKEVPLDVMEDICSFADQNKASVPWRKGDIMIVDNRMAKHSRQTFTGPRKVFAALLKSKKETMKVESSVLRSGDQMPLLGFGTWKIGNDQCEETVYKAIKNGYRLIDCACDYANEKQVGLGIKRAIKEGIVARKDLFITSKLWNTYHRPEHVGPALQRSLQDLGLDYLDLYLVHFPISLKFVPFEKRYPPFWFYEPDAKNPKMEEEPVPIIDTWRAMEDLVNLGLVRNIGVCNFRICLLRDLIYQAKVLPSVSQNEIHPYLTQKPLIRFCRENGIQMTSYSTFGASSYIELSMASETEKIENIDLFKKLAHRYQKTIHQVVLRWAVQLGLAIIPKSKREEKIIENSNIFDFVLENEEMAEIDLMNANRRFNDPQVFCEKAFNTYFPIYD